MAYSSQRQRQRQSGNGKPQAYPSRTNIHAGIAADRNPEKWSNGLNFRFRNNTITRFPRKVQLFDLSV